jgi:hypothetical protein
VTPNETLSRKSPQGQISQVSAGGWYWHDVKCACIAKDLSFSDGIVVNEKHQGSLFVLEEQIPDA